MIPLGGIMTSDWGPRPAGPPAPPERQSGSGFALLCILFVVGMYSLANGGGWFALLLLTAPLGYLLAPLARVAYKAITRARRRRREPAELVSQTPDPFIAARDYVRRLGGCSFLGLRTDNRDWLTAECEHAVLVLGPPRSGKTSCVIIPSVLVSPGPVVSTSTKMDVLRATAENRSRLGRVWSFDPSGTEVTPPGVLELHWSPVHQARTWDGARAMADAMVDASAAGEGVADATYWTESAKTLLGPLLHAAALSDRTVLDVRRWVARPAETGEAGRVLDGASATVAADDLEAILTTEERERSSIFSSTRQVLTAYASDPAAARSREQNFDADRFARSCDTLYITAPAAQQAMVAPLIAGLLEEIRHAVYRLARECGRIDLPMLWALDEAANIAPLKKLPAIVSEAGGQGLQVMACFQDISQARVRWGAAAEGFLSLFGTKVVFSGIGDRGTLESLSILAGDWDRTYRSLGRNTGRTSGSAVTRSKGISWTEAAKREAQLSPSEIANLPPRHALLVGSSGSTEVQAGRWALMDTAPYTTAKPWLSLASSAPDGICYQGGVDDLSQPLGRFLPESRDPNSDEGVA